MVDPFSEYLTNVDRLNLLEKAIGSTRYRHALRLDAREKICEVAKLLNCAYSLARMIFDYAKYQSCAFQKDVIEDSMNVFYRDDDEYIVQLTRTNGLDYIKGVFTDESLFHNCSMFYHFSRDYSTSITVAERIPSDEHVTVIFRHDPTEVYFYAKESGHYLYGYVSDHIEISYYSSLETLLEKHGQDSVGREKELLIELFDRAIYNNNL